MRAGLFIFAALLLLVLPGSARAEHELVLVTSTKSGFSGLSILEIRKAYLGFDVTSEGSDVRPLTNRSSERAWSIFLQNVIGMSERSYDRRMLSLTLQTGRSRPPEMTSLEALLDYLASHPNQVAFVWEEDIEDRDDLQVVRVLWRQ